MKRIILMLCTFSFLGICPDIPVFAQSGETAGLVEADIDEEADLPRYEHWWEWLHGLSVGLETGVHEYPLAIWFPSNPKEPPVEGYSIRAFFMKPFIGYERAFGDVTAGLKLDTTIDVGAPDPKPDALAMNAKNADRENWYTIKIEEDVDWIISNLFGEDVEFPGVLSVYLQNKNNIYAYPKFPETPERNAGKAADGILEIGVGRFAADTPAGWFLGQIGMPQYYLNRFNGDVGSGMNLTFGYRAFFNLGIEITSRTMFAPKVEQYQTEFILTYTWLDLGAKLDIIAHGPFTSASIKPEVQYRLDAFDFIIGANIENLGQTESFSPFVSVKWTY